MKLTSKHIEFCELYYNGATASEAYAKAYNNHNSGTCRANSSALLKKPEIQEYIQSLQSVAKAITEAANAKTAEKVSEYQVATVAERMQILTQIARGEIPLYKPMVCDGVIENVPVVPDWMDRKNAIAELNKMDGSYAPTKATINVNKAGLDAIAESYEP